jgi:two-component system, NarL family, response regulator LiaR
MRGGFGFYILDLRGYWETMMMIDNRPNMTRILLVDDHKNVRNALSTYLGVYEDLKVVGEAANGQEAVDLCRHFQPDVVLMDLNLPGMDGITTMQIIKKEYPSVQVIILTGFGDLDTKDAAMRAGAVAYLSKDRLVDELYTVIQTVIS